jgi:hypothetical protein
MAKQTVKRRDWTKEDVRMLKTLAREKTTVIARRLQFCSQSTLIHRHPSMPALGPPRGTRRTPSRARRRSPRCRAPPESDWSGFPGRTPWCWASGNAVQGISVALSGDGNTAIIGGDSDASTGAAWVFVQPALQVSPATNISASSNPGGPFAPSSFQ